MRFKTLIRNISTFTKLTSSLTSLGKVAWMRLDEQEVRFTVIPELGTQVWAVLSIGTLFTSYRIASAASNVINLEIPLDTLYRALKSCPASTSSFTQPPSLRLTKRTSDSAPILCLTVPVRTTYGGSAIVTHEVPIRVLSANSVAHIVEPTCPEPDVHIILPPLYQLRAITDRFQKLVGVGPGGTNASSASSGGFKLRLAANMNGVFSLSLTTPTVTTITTTFTNLMNPSLDPAQVEDIANHPSTTRPRDEMCEVIVNGKEWQKVLRCWGISRRVIACFCKGVAMVVYVYLTEEDEVCGLNDDGEEEGMGQAVLTYYLGSLSS